MVWRLRHGRWHLRLKNASVPFALDQLDRLAFLLWKIELVLPQSTPPEVHRVVAPRLKHSLVQCRSARN